MITDTLWNMPYKMNTQIRWQTLYNVQPKKKTQVTKTKLDYKPAIGIYKSILQGNPIFGKISKIKYVHKQLYDN